MKKPKTWLEMSADNKQSKTSVMPKQNLIICGAKGTGKSELANFISSLWEDAIVVIDLDFNADTIKRHVCSLGRHMNSNSHIRVIYVTQDQIAYDNIITPDNFLIVTLTL